MKDGQVDEQRQPGFAELVRRHGQFYFRMAVRMLADPADAEDACQSAFMKVWRNRHGIREPKKMKAYLTTAVIHSCQETIRRRQRSRTHGFATESDLPHAADPVPLTQLANRESIHAALAGLPDRTRTVVVMRLVQGLSGRETSKALSCSQSEVSRRLHDGMARLRDALTAQELETRR